MTPLTVCVIGCGKAKLTEPARAKDLYVGSLFRAARRYAERFGHWRIISAKHGVLDPEKVIAPYELRLPRGLEGCDKWGVKVACELIDSVSHALDDERPIREQLEIVVLAGADYADPLCAHLARLRVPFRCPLAGFELGARMRWFKQQGLLCA